jgi:hypothetical protein
MYLTKKKIIIINKTQFSEHIQISHWQQVHLDARTEHEIVRYSKEIPTYQHNKKNGIIERTQMRKGNYYLINRMGYQLDL